MRGEDVVKVSGDSLVISLQLVQMFLEGGVLPLEFVELIPNNSEQTGKVICNFVSLLVTIMYLC